MKITRREGKEAGGVFAVSVTGRQFERVESAMSWLEDLAGKTASQIVVDLIIQEAIRNGWEWRKVEAHPRDTRPEDSKIQRLELAGV